jgi:type IV secretory pathway VirJ component
MHRPALPWLLGLALSLFVTAPALAAPRQITVKEEVLGEVTILAPAEEPQIFAALLSDTDGFSPSFKAAADKLVAGGAAVALIDTRAFIDALDKSDEENCHYAFGDIEDAARVAQRELGMKTWRWPVLLGLGDLGGALAYMSIAQTPDNTAAGAVSTGLATKVASHLVMCEGSVGKKDAAGIWEYTPAKTLPARWTYVSAVAPSATVQPFLSAKGTASVVAPGDGDALLDAAVKATLEIGAPPAEELGDLPLVELPTEGPPIGLAIFLSGDGGWRDIDKTIGEILQKEGVAVVGVDSLRYFWSTKDPDAIASDLSRIVAYYTKLWGAKRVGIIGYSLGADVVPFAWQKFPPQVQKQVNLLALLGLEPTADFQISVAGWLGVSSDSDVDLKPYLPTLPMQKTMCFYGEEEIADNETACVDPAMAKATIVQRPGGHHFDGDYETVARMILNRLKQP